MALPVTALCLSQPPPLSPSLSHNPLHKDSHGCTMSPSFDNEIPSHKTLQPYKPVCDNNANNNNNKHNMTTIHVILMVPFSLMPRTTCTLMKLEQGFFKRHGRKVIILTLKQEDIISFIIMLNEASLGATTSTMVLLSYSLLYSMTHGNLQDHPTLLPSILMRTVPAAYYVFDTKGQKIKGKFLTMALISIYFPCDDHHHEKFCTILDSILNSINSNTQVIIGDDINA